MKNPLRSRSKFYSSMRIPKSSEGKISKYYRKKSKDILKNHFIDTTAALSVANPVLSAFEVCPLNNMEDIESIAARVTGTGLFYLGLGSVFSKGRDISKKVFGITKDTSKVLRFGCDAVYGTAFGFTISHVVYPLSSLISGETFTYGQVFVASSIAAAISVPVGIGGGYSVDTFRDLTGLEEFDMIPECVKRQKPFVKKGLAGLLTVGSVGVMAGIYALTR